MHTGKTKLAAAKTTNPGYESMTVYNKQSGSGSLPAADTNGILTVQNLEGNVYGYVYNNATITNLTDYNNKGASLVATSANNSSANGGNTVFTLQIVSDGTVTRFKETGTYLVQVLEGGVIKYLTDVSFVNGCATVDIANFLLYSDLSY
jgi:hypothetical protein